MEFKKDDAIEKILEVFGPHLNGQDYLEIVRSERHGYVLLRWDEETGDYTDASRIRTSAYLLEELLNDIAVSYLIRSGKEHDIFTMDEEDKAAIDALQEKYLKALLNS